MTRSGQHNAAKGIQESALLTIVDCQTTKTACHHIVDVFELKDLRLQMVGSA